MPLNIRKSKRLISIILTLSVITLLLFTADKVVRYLYPLDYQEIVIEYAQVYNLDKWLVFAVIKAESSFDKNAVSRKGAVGLMQLTPSTARWASSKMKLIDYDDSKLFVPEYNINIGCWYLKSLAGIYGGNIRVALAAYNAGSSNVNKWLSDNDNENLQKIPFKETFDFVNRVDKYRTIYKVLYGR